MNANLVQAQQCIHDAREALRNGDRSVARRWAEQAAVLAPQLEDPWLLLAAVSNPRASVAFIERALKINPDSLRAQKGMQWAVNRLQENPPQEMDSPELQPLEDATQPVEKTQPAGAAAKKPRRTPVYPFILLALGCVVVLLTAWTASTNPALASILGGASRPGEIEHPQVWAQVEIAKPTNTVQPAPALAQVEATPLSFIPTVSPPTLAPTLEPALEPASSTPTLELAPTAVLEPAPTITQDAGSAPMPESTATPASLVMEVLPDTPTPVSPPTSESKAPTAKPQEQAKPAVGNGVRWIDVNLSEQRLYAYEGDVAMNMFVVSTGTWATPTVTGTFKIWNKTRIQDMSGPGYYLPNVPYVMYFYKDYGIHGTYWHNNFGTPMSHGCINLTIPDAEWLYSWAYEGMTVKVHY